MSDERLREAFERGLPAGRDLPEIDDVAAERLRRLVEHEGSDEERLHTLDQLLSTGEGRRDLEIVWGAARAARVRTSWKRAWVGVAATMVLAVPLLWVALKEPTDVMRGEDSPITLVAPLDNPSREQASRFIWRRLSDAERYTLVVVDAASGEEVYAAETNDTTVVLPDSVALVAGRSYLWWVQARTALGASVTAVTERLTIRP
jgi:hypothetical protein